MPQSMTDGGPLIKSKKKDTCEKFRKCPIVEAAESEPESELPQLIERPAVRGIDATHAANALHDTDTGWLDLSQVDNELRRLIEAWPRFPNHIRIAINALVAGTQVEKGSK